MRQLIVEVPKGELANLENITLVEAEKPKERATKRFARVHGLRLARMKRTSQFVILTVQPGGQVVAHPTMAPAPVKLEAAPSLAKREQRMKALGKVFGILKGRDDCPQDGLAFQLEMREE